MNEITIVKYDPKYAQSIADMWNESGENWGGYNEIKTPESVIKEQEKSSQIVLYLAIYNEKVVGSCNFAIYEYDENTLYIPLLNVHPKYHGKKVGKALDPAGLLGIIPLLPGALSRDQARSLTICQAICVGACVGDALQQQSSM